MAGQPAVDGPEAAAQLPVSIGDVIQLASLAGVASYGAGWVFFAAFYNQFKLQPEAAGIGAEYIIVRAAVVASIMALLAAIVFFSTSAADWVQKGRQGNVAPFYAVVSFDAALMFLLSGGASALLIRYQWNLPIIVTIVIGAGIGAIASAFESIAVARAVNFSRSSGRGPVLGTLRARWIISALALWFVVLLPIAAGAGVAAAKSVRAGHPLSNLVMSVPTVDVFVHSTVVLPDEMEERNAASGGQGLCGLRLGQTSTSVIFFDPSTAAVVTFPPGAVTQALRPSAC